MLNGSDARFVFANDNGDYPAGNRLHNPHLCKHSPRIEEALKMVA